MTHPDRETSQNRIEQLQIEQKLLEERECKLEEKLDIRKKQFHVLVSSIHQLQDLLAADEELSQKTGLLLRRSQSQSISLSHFRGYIKGQLHQR